jgi:protein-arginine kinase activator protein McsA
MKIEIRKDDFYKAMIKSLVDKEEYELAAKVRDTIKNLENPDETYVIDIEEDGNNYKQK